MKYFKLFNNNIYQSEATEIFMRIDTVFRGV